MAFFSLSDIFGKPKQNPNTKDGTDGKDPPDFLDNIKYEVVKENWYTARPYGFKTTDRNRKSTVMFLPISPSNLTINTNFATNVISTLYGTVEEHSDVRYYDITIEGTTGIAPKYVSPGQAESKVSAGRQRFPVSGSVINLGGFAAKTIALANSILNKATELVDGSPKAETGVFKDQTGYLAFHNLYRFLLKYKKDVAGDANSTQARSEHPLTFFNYKDNNEYSVAIRGFSLRRSAENPMLYNYSIQLRGYDLRTAGQGKLGDNELTQRLSDLGLNGVDGSSLLGRIKGTSNKIKGILGPLGAGINILGR